MMSATDQAVLVFQKHGGILRTSQAIAAGIHPRTLYAMRDSKGIEKVGRGVFRLSGLPRMSDPDIVFVAKRIPSAVICLRSALAIHELTTQIPHTVQIALPPGTHSPRIEYPPIEGFQVLSAGAGCRNPESPCRRSFSQGILRRKNPCRSFQVSQSHWAGRCD
jgi:predicted transcriptional regulator of viral defense system